MKRSLFIRVDLRPDATEEDFDKARDALHTYVRVATQSDARLTGAHLATVTCTRERE